MMKIVYFAKPKYYDKNQKILNETQLFRKKQFLPFKNIPTGDTFTNL
ncbi:MAG: hypothetical protein ACLU85_10325 [Lachnospirales bacterium]|jgi:hypothetical protein